jgi:ADP-ribosylglycohydrolase/O-acetyl-ADP-ribose deacetylase (regulator of RNase III)
VDAWQDRCRGAMLGGGIGDALGLPAESLPPWLIRLRYPRGPHMRRGYVRLTRRAGDISDDTQLSIAVARSIDGQGRYLHERFLDELRIWHPQRIGAGRACATAARRLARCRQPLLKADVALSSAGNGALMRVAPLAIARANDRSLDGLIADVRQNAAVTHGGHEAIDGAVFVALLIALSLRADKGSFRGEILEAAFSESSRLSGFPLPLLAAQAEVPGGPKEMLRDTLRRRGNSGYVVHTVGAVITVLRHCGNNYRQAMREIFFAGGDSDSIAAIVMAVVGGQVGSAALPQEWLKYLQHRDYLVHQSDRLSRPLGVEGAREGQILVVSGDIATRSTEVIVNAWNRNVIPAQLLLPQGVSKAIRRAGGKEAIRQMSARAPLPLGAASETRVGSLNAKAVIHVAGIDLLWRASEFSVRTSARQALLLARCLSYGTLALPLIGAGSGGLSPKRVKAILMEEMEAQASHFDRLELVLGKKRGDVF